MINLHRIELIRLLIVVSMQAMEELGHFQLLGLITDLYDMGPFIIMLKHEVMVVDEWHNNGPRDLVTVSLLHSNCH
jgi:sorbitol-specific phosphotransferase system component IIA